MKLQSEWMGLSPHLMATFYACDYDGKPKTDEPEVSAPLINDASLDIALNWQSPFEASGADTRAPALTAMLQSGAIQPVLNAVRDVVMGSGVSGAEKTQSGFAAASDTAKKLQGKTGITKLNSTQIFSGMQPIKLPVTAIFRAYRNPVNEVVKPAMQLIKWALPQKLAIDGALTNVLQKVAEGSKDVGEYLEALLPSEAPQLIGFQYKTWSISPMVIESISIPILSPIDQSGNYTELSIPMMLSTLTALDRNDLAKITGGRYSRIS